MAMLGIGIVVIVWVAARIYRVGILMTGKRPSVKEVVRWVRVG
jgi:ABC-2 type transport system permease protein